MSRHRIAASLFLVLIAACKRAETPETVNVALAGPARGTNEWKIQDAMSAAPTEISSAAAIMDYPASPTAQPTQLRAGTNGWACFPDMPETPSDDPVCVDATWADWFGAWMQHKPPHVTKVGIAYMLQGADDPSNTDPFATKPDSGKSWIHNGPHIMVIAPGNAMYAGMATEPKVGVPYVMFPGTPYAHLMVPSQAPARSAM
jgi:hypothetical protein